MRALTRASPRSMRVHVCVWAYFVLSAHLWSTHGWAQPEAVHLGAWCRSWVIDEKTLQPKRLRDQLFSPERWCVRMEEASVIKKWVPPTASGPGRSVSLTLCLCNWMFMQWKGQDCVEVDDSGAVVDEGVGMVCTHLALITIFQRKLDCCRQNSIYI